MNVSTQLRLIQRADGAAAATSRPARTRAARADAAPRPLRGRAGGASRPGTRRAVHWEGRWRLDEQTRQIGRAGIASARAALEAAHRDDDLRRAS